MMQQAKFMNLLSLTAAKQEIDVALNELEANPSNTQTVYTNLTLIYNLLADHPQVQAQLVVDSKLASQIRVKLVRDLVRMYIREEEVQWVLGRVIVLACKASLRFQCLAGQFEIWNELFEMRSTHPQSIRVQEVSLHASEALFHSNELNATKLQPLLLLDDLIGIINRFRRVQTPRRRAHQLVVLALRVLLALYSSPRPVKLLLFNDKNASESDKWANEIIRQMLESFTIFNSDSIAIRDWLDMVLLLLRQHPIQALTSFFSDSWWFLAVVESWKPQSQVMNALFSTLTHVFALPHKTLGGEEQIALAERFIVEQNLLDVVCKVLDHYHNAMLAPVTGIDGSITGSQHDSVRLVLLEAIRLVRQWTERPTLLTRLGTSFSVKNTLVPAIIDQIQLYTRQLSMSPKYLVLVLEILLILRRLAAISTLYKALVVSEKLQLSLKRLHRGRNIPDTPLDSSATTRRFAGTTAITSNFRDDGDLVALVAREACELHKLLGFDAGPKSANKLVRKDQKSDTTVIVVTAAPRKLRLEYLRMETLSAYGKNR